MYFITILIIKFIHLYLVFIYLLIFIIIIIIYSQELREMMGTQYAMSLLQIVAMVPCDFYIQWEDVFSKREGL